MAPTRPSTSIATRAPRDDPARRRAAPHRTTTEASPWPQEALEAIEPREDFHAFAHRYPDRVVEALGEEVDALEEKIRSEIPEAKHLDIETH